jgi:hypothetical protein
LKAKKTKKRQKNVAIYRRETRVLERVRILCVSFTCLKKEIVVPPALSFIYPPPPRPSRGSLHTQKETLAIQEDAFLFHLLFFIYIFHIFGFSIQKARLTKVFSAMERMIAPWQHLVRSQQFETAITKIEAIIICIIEVSTSTDADYVSMTMFC